MDPTTSKFKHALPYSVLRVSPSLAALYTTRHTTHSDSCSKCGSYLLNGNATIRLVRQPKRSLRRTCHACGWTNELVINALSRDDPISQEPTPVPDSLPLPPSKSKPRPKKKTGLQDMLARSREKQKDEQSRRSDGQVGLAAFLTDL
jgi:RNase P subunit RPR2